MEQNQRYRKPLKELCLLSKEDYARKSNEIYLSHTVDYYVAMLRRCVIYYCSHKYEDIDDDTVSYFTCDNLLRFIDEHFPERRK